ncbi:MAG: carbonic anhydrase [Acetobacteraceae bacterium]
MTMPSPKRGSATGGASDPGAPAPEPSVTGATSLTPEASLAALMAGNARYAGARLRVCARNLPAALRETEYHQAPIASVLACADSRVPVELVFDQGVGRVFVARVAGNIATPEIIASLEYGVAVLGTPVIMVLGHRNCGAVAATMARMPAPGRISSLYAFIRPAVECAGADADKAIRINATMQAEVLARTSPVLSGAIAERRLRIVPAYYDVGSGKVTLLDP